MQTYTYYQAARCECGFLWTTVADSSVVCVCGSVSIFGDVATGVTLPFTAADLQTAIAHEILVAPADLIVERG